jgi:C-terminal processing protease CtpA/Prc
VVATALLAAIVVTACASYGTIGAVLAQRPDGRLFVRDTPLALASSNAGIQPGDEILLIDGRDVRAMDAKGVHHALEGDVGDSVHLTVLRGEQVTRITLHLTPAPPMRKTE